MPLGAAERAETWIISGLAQKVGKICARAATGLVAVMRSMTEGALIIEAGVWPQGPLHRTSCDTSPFVGGNRSCTRCPLRRALAFT